MGATLPALQFETFAGHLADHHDRSRASGEGKAPLGRATLVALFAHYDVLRQWNPRLSLVGPGTANEVITRHYGESLRGLSLIQPGAKSVVDLGSGGGFPGFVLAAARADCSVVLAEARQRKWSFLGAAIRHGKAALKAADEDPDALSCVALNARITRPLPPGLPGHVDLVTSRAVHLTEALLGVVLHRWPAAHFLLWRGEDSDELPAGIDVLGRTKIDGTRHRTIVLAGADTAPTGSV